ncbi:MAG: hypothetical protein KBA60_09785 [Flavobacteriales bacterium]|nr:hypothetical protein [Flavobacteriales bacterium]MBP7156287.1 hypothetical protein [Flavobacteriales bacterium]
MKLQERTSTITSIMLLLVLASIPERSFAQDDRSYARTVYERCPDADILKIQHAEFDLVEVDYLCNGKKMEVGFRNGKVVYEEQEADLDAAVFAKIQQALGKKYPGWLLDEISLIAAKDTTFLKVEVMLDGVEHNVFFTTTGRKFKPDALLASNKWTLCELAATDLPNSGYDLLAPDSTYHLPDVLREVSGIALSGPNTVVCVQDELGVVFEYDLVNDAITKIHRFTDIGDFEDIAVQGDVITVLRSDGKLHQLDRKTGKLLSERLDPLSSLNYEGLFQDGTHLFILGKEAPVIGPAHARPIHHMHNSGTPELWRTLDAEEVSRVFATSFPELAHHGVRFHPSALAIHPITGELYVLSAGDRLLAIYGDTLRAVVPLPAERFYKPEGLAFHPNGDLLISNEGDKKGLMPGSILQFTYLTR